MTKKKTSVRIAEFAFVLSAIALTATGVKFLMDNYDEMPLYAGDGLSSVSDSSNSAGDLLSQIAEEKDDGFTDIDVDNSTLGMGDLILVNKDHAFTSWDKIELLNIFEYENKSDSYSLKDRNVVACKVFVDALNTMLSEFYGVSGIDDIMLKSAYRTYEHQQELYGDGAEGNLVAPPGNSEHHTGLAVDFSLFKGSYMEDFTGEGEYAWIMNNCHKYGLINRYTVEKRDITKYDAETWHFRYVGVPHSYIMKEKNMCLEEYIEFIKGFSNLEPCSFDVSDTEKYIIYYVAADASATSTKVPVPDDITDYTVSGNNVDGFIVTVKMP